MSEIWMLNAEVWNTDAHKVLRFVFLLLGGAFWVVFTLALGVIKIQGPKIIIIWFYLIPVFFWLAGEIILALLILISIKERQKEKTKEKTRN